MFEGKLLEGLSLALLILCTVIIITLQAGDSQSIWGYCIDDKGIKQCKLIEGEGVYINGIVYPEEVMINVIETELGLALLVDLDKR